MAAAARKRGWFSKIETREDALKVVRDTSSGFFVLAAIQGLLGYVFAPVALIDVAVLLVLGVILRKWHSRVAAVLLLLFPIPSAALTVLNGLGLMEQGGISMTMVAIMLLVAVRAVEATFMLHGRFAAPTTGGA